MATWVPAVLNMSKFLNVPTCLDARYRNPEGWCNHLASRLCFQRQARKPQSGCLGAVNSFFRRRLPPAYQDGQESDLFTCNANEDNNDGLIFQDIVWMTMLVLWYISQWCPQISQPANISTLTLCWKPRPRLTSRWAEPVGAGRSTRSELETAPRSKFSLWRLWHQTAASARKRPNLWPWDTRPRHCKL